MVRTDEVRRAREEYDRIYLVVVGEHAAEQKHLEVSPEPVNGSPAVPASVEEKTAEGDTTLSSITEDDRTLLSDRERVLTYLVKIYPHSCPKLQIARTLGIDQVRVVPALKDLEREGRIEDVGPDQWRSKKPPENP